MSLSENEMTQGKSTMQVFLKIVGNGQRTARDLTPAEAEAAIQQVLDGRATPAQVAAFMAVLRIKEESSDELAAFTRILRQHCERLELNHPHLVDICQPYDGRSKSLSVVPAAALIAAAAGAKIALHGRPGQNTPPKFGIGMGDIFAQLGIAIDLPLRAAASLIEDDEIGVAFAASAQFAPVLERFNSIRVEYGMRSFLNTIEKLINPFGAPSAIVGVFHGPVLARVAGAMQAQQYQRGIAVQGPEGAIDVVTSRRANLIEFTAPDVMPVEWAIDPTAFDWWERSEVDSAFVVNTPENAALTLRILSTPDGVETPDRSFQRGVLMTAALMIYTAGKATTFEHGLERAQEALASGRALARLNKLRAASQALKPVIAT